MHIIFFFNIWNCFSFKWIFMYAYFQVKNSLLTRNIEFISTLKAFKWNPLGHISVKCQRSVARCSATGYRILQMTVLPKHPHIHIYTNIQKSAPLTLLGRPNKSQAIEKKSVKQKWREVIWRSCDCAQRIEDIWQRIIVVTKAYSAALGERRAKGPLNLQCKSRAV